MVRAGRLELPRTVAAAVARASPSMGLDQVAGPPPWTDRGGPEGRSARFAFQRFGKRVSDPPSGRKTRRSARGWTAACAVRHVLLGEAEQGGVKGRPLLGAQCGEEAVLELLGNGSQARERASTGRRQLHVLAAAIAGVAPALDKPALFELVEQADELAAVVAKRVGDCSLRLARALVQHCENGVVSGVETKALVGLQRLLLGSE